MKLKYILPLLLPLLAACGAPKPTPTADAAALRFDKEQVWQLVAQRGKEVASTADPVLLMFHPESGTLRGRVACNRYFADYKLRLDRVAADGSHYRLEVLYVSGGDVQCPEGDMAAQERYLALLAKADACLLTPVALTLFQKGREVLKYELQ
ncbi:MAG: META domain-containing protein [Bacteroidales bacterium]|nr:META domain-containing protein [Bacteroidales bacterium]